MLPFSEDRKLYKAYKKVQQEMPDEGGSWWGLDTFYAKLVDYFGKRLDVSKLSEPVKKTSFGRSLVWSSEGKYPLSPSEGWHVKALLLEMTFEEYKTLVYCITGRIPTEKFWSYGDEKRRLYKLACDTFCELVNRVHTKSTIQALDEKPLEVLTCEMLRACAEKNDAILAESPAYKSLHKKVSMLIGEISKLQDQGSAAYALRGKLSQLGQVYRLHVNQALVAESVIKEQINSL
jgi:hypothetical protein